jgi:esterase/lipase
LRAVPKLFGSDVSDPDVRRAMRQAGSALPAMPLVALQSLLELMAEVRGDLDGISAPALVAHGRRDRAVPISDSLELADRLDALVPGREAAVAVERLWLDRSRHLVGVDVESDVLSRAVGHFLTTRGRW